MGVTEDKQHVLTQLETYNPPAWAKPLTLVPRNRFVLGTLPTPISPWKLPDVPDGVELWLKQDSLSGLELSGNKVRKLEFLLAEAVSRGCDCVVTLGGIQSNHARATACAAAMLGLEAHLILRTTRTLLESDPGLVGNLLLERLVGAHVHQVSKEEYAQLGQVKLGQLLADELRAAGKRPYIIPVGGSSALGTWGYLQAVEEIRQQAGHDAFTDIVMACGSGATSAGLALGVLLSGQKSAVTAYCVCDDEDYFYDYIDGLLADLGATPDKIGSDARGMLHVVQAKGAGYAISQQEELLTVQKAAMATGIILDPVYTGKALHGLLSDMRREPGKWQGRRVLFLHSGGIFGMYDKAAQLQPLVEGLGRAGRMKLD